MKRLSVIGLMLCLIIPGLAFAAVYLYDDFSGTEIDSELWNDLDTRRSVESGKLVSNIILDKYKKEKVFYYQHKLNSLYKTFRFVDKLLYKMNMPNIIDTLILFVSFIILIILIRVTIKAR